MSWPRFIALFVLVFFLFNLIFAALYFLDPGGLNMPVADSATRFFNAFFFSVHTVATVGYGNMYPIDVLTNVIVVIEITFGLLFFALASGLVFGRFSRPTARVLFSNVAVAKNFEGVRTLMFRAANQRHNFVFEANVRCSVLRLEMIEGKQMRRFYDSKLDRASTPVFALTWLIRNRNRCLVDCSIRASGNRFTRARPMGPAMYCGTMSSPTFFRWTKLAEL